MCEACERLGRRGFIGAAIKGMAALFAGSAAAQQTRERRLRFYHTHTGEALDVAYWRQGSYVPEALSRVNRFLRDFRTGDVKTIDPELLDQLVRVRGLVGAPEDAVFHVISAYRSPKTNEMLRGSSGGVAKGSQHLLGRAIDVRLLGVPVGKLRDAALSMKAGGVGYYPDSDFVHLDTGRVRFW